MILIISRDGDASTHAVIDCLIHYKLPYLRVNDDLYYNIFIDFENFSKSKIYDNKISEIKVVWFRKNTMLFNEDDQNNIIKKLDKSIIAFSNAEILSFRNYFFEELSKIKSIKWLTNPNKMTENKLIQMQNAKSVGLQIPKSFIVTKKSGLQNTTSSKDTIVKPIVNCVHPFIDGTGILMKTTLIKTIEAELPQSFPVSLVQHLIDKAFEIRVFYINNEFFATKIVEHENIEVDHRVNIAMNNARFENFSLPKIIKRKLKKLLDKFELNCSSIDLIVDKKGMYYFLELNPTGQFSYHSFFNNTYLDMKIAQTLKKLYYAN